MSKFIPAKKVFKQNLNQQKAKAQAEAPHLKNLCDKIVEKLSNNSFYSHEEMTRDESLIYNKYLRTKNILIQNELNIIQSRKEIEK